MAIATTNVHIINRGGKRLNILIAINLEQLQINLQLILDFNLENITYKSNSMIVTAGIAVIHSLCDFAFTI